MEEERSETANKYQVKREHVRDNKLKHDEELDQAAYQGYIEYI